MSIFSIFTRSPPPAPNPKVKTFLLKWSQENKRASLQKKGDKRGKKCIPIMLVQALQYPNTACERGTAGRHTKSIAPGLWFCVVSQRGWSFLPPTASWKQDWLRLIVDQNCTCPYNEVWFISLTYMAGNSGPSTLLQSMLQPFVTHHISQI